MDAIGFDEFVAAGGGEAGDGGGDGLGISFGEFDDADVVEMGEAGADTDAFAGFVGIGRGAVGGAGLREEGAVAEALGELFGGDGNGDGVDGARSRGGEDEEEQRRGEKAEARKGAEAGRSGARAHGEVDAR
jgi:hypothetical protein